MGVADTSTSLVLGEVETVDEALAYGRNFAAEEYAREFRRALEAYEHRKR